MRRKTGLVGLFLVIACCLLVSFAWTSEAKADVLGTDLVNYARNYIGKVPYVSGGNTIDGSNPGADCSGFLCAVYGHFGIDMWAHRTYLTYYGSEPYGITLNDAVTALKNNNDVSGFLPGDILIFNINNVGHVGMYSGNGNMIHCTTQWFVKDQQPSDLYWYGTMEVPINVKASGSAYWTQPHAYAGDVMRKGLVRAIRLHSVKQYIPEAAPPSVVVEFFADGHKNFTLHCYAAGENNKISNITITIWNDISGEGNARIDSYNYTYSSSYTLEDAFDVPIIDNETNTIYHCRTIVNDVGGNSSYVDASCYIDSIKPEVIEARIENVTEEGYDVYCKGKDNTDEMSGFWIRTWHDGMGEGNYSDQYSIDSTYPERCSEFCFHVSRADFGNFEGFTFHTDVYAIDRYSNVSDPVRAGDPYKPKPNLTSVAFSKANATVKQNVTITAETSTNAEKLTMYTDGNAVKSWTTGYTDSGEIRTWKVTYAFTGAGAKTLSFRASDNTGTDSEEKTASISISKAPTMTSVSFSKSKATVKQKVTITAVTSTNANKITMYSGSSAIKSWTTGYTDKDGQRTWKVTYAFSGAGTRTMSFKATDANGAVTAAKKATIVITKAPTLSSVKFGTGSVVVKKNVRVIAVTSTNATKLTMYNGSQAVKSWTSGYKDSGTTRTWNVTYAFSGAGQRTLSFKAFDANGAATAAKKASITVTQLPTLTSVEFGADSVGLKKNVKIIAITSTNATKLTMYNGSKAVKTWTSGYTDNGKTRTWKVTYAFSGSGIRTMTFKAGNASGMSTGKKATIEVLK